MTRIQKSWRMAALLAALPVVACSGTSQLVGSDDPAGGTSNGGAASGPTQSRSAFVDQVVTTDPSLCLPIALSLDAAGAPTCVLTTARLAPDCTCTAPGLAPAADGLAAAVRVTLEASGRCSVGGSTPSCADFCVCDVLPATGASLTQCQTEAQPAADTSGWCYVDARHGSTEAALVANCAENQQQRLRLFGAASPQADAIDVIACEDVRTSPTTTPATAAALGEPCIAADEYVRDFPGFDAKEVNVVDHDAACSSQVCLLNHFQGRASCKYGQPADGSAAGGPCVVPGSTEPVSVAVLPQLVTRQADVASICSCHCAGDGPGPFCTCPDSMQCEHLVDDFGLPGDGVYAGSYCIPKGSAYDQRQLLQGSCSTAQNNCGAGP